MVVAYSSNRNWYKYMCVNIYSLLKNNSEINKIYLFVEDDDITKIDNLEKIINYFGVEVVLINFNLFLGNYISEDSPNYHNKFTTFSLSRLFLSDFVSEDKVLYIDVDALVVKNISYLDKIDISDYYVCGIKDHGVLDGEYDHYLELGIDGKYINSGFILLNLKKIREDDIVSLFSKLLSEKEFRYPDQDVLNIACNDKIKYIHSMYNFIVDTDGFFVTLDVRDISKVRVFHYAGVKNPWVEDRLYGEEWYQVEEEYYYFLEEVR